MSDGLSVVHLAMEMAPLAKVGGLGDVLDGLSRALAERGHRITVVLPRYGFLAGIPSTVLPGEAVGGARLHRIDLPEHPARVLLLETAPFSARDGVYTDPATGEAYPESAAFIGFAEAALELLVTDDPPPDVLHVHDYHPALVPTLLARTPRHRASRRRVRTVLTIHNLGYQGIYDRTEVAAFLREHPAVRPALGFHGRVNFLKAGILDADAVTTVSPTYAREILSPELGFGLESVLGGRPDGVHGILNGIDTRVWNPAADPHLQTVFDAGSLERKRVNKEALGRRAGFSETDRPVIGMVSRLTGQKGIDLLLKAMPEILKLGPNLVVLGSGDPGFERELEALASRHPDRVFFSDEFDDPLAHTIQGGADLFLMPSRFEPCGLTQMIAMRYGTVPVVRGVGGLADTVQPVAEGGDEGSGFVFREYSPPALIEALRAALAALDDPARWAAIQRRGMAVDSSWTGPAAAYEALYRAL